MVDPTAIEIDFDPTVQRMKGVTVHGGMPFDVPIISEIGPNLWQGGCRDGLHEARVNYNQGAESTLSFLLALAEITLLTNSLAAFHRLTEV